MQTTITDKAKEKLSEWKTLAKHLKVQLHLGREEAREAFEEQKKKAAAWADSAMKELNDTKEIGEDKARELKHEFEMLRTYGMLKQAETEQELKEQQEKISNSIDKIKSKLEQAYAASADNVSDWKDSVGEKLQYYKMSFDLFKVQLHLGSDEAKNKWEQTKEKISTKVDEINKDLDEATEQGEEKFDAVASELNQSWKNVKAIFSK